MRFECSSLTHGLRRLRMCSGKKMCRALVAVPGWQAEVQAERVRDG